MLVRNGSRTPPRLARDQVFHGSFQGVLAGRQTTSRM
jgi:hypothetical protein